MPSLNATILIVEDDTNDILFLKMALEATGISNPIIEAKDGKEAQKYLSQTGCGVPQAQHPVPYLMFLDLKLPHLMGLDLLKWVRQQPEMYCMVVIVLTSSANPADIDAAYRLGANAYLVKPSGFEKLCVLTRSVKDFWLVHNQPGADFGEEG